MLLSVRSNETNASPGRRHGTDSSPDEIKRRNATIAKIEVLLRLSRALATRRGTTSTDPTVVRMMAICFDTRGKRAFRCWDI